MTKKVKLITIGEKMSEDKQVNQPQNDVQEAEVKQTQTDEKPTAHFNQEHVDK